MSIECPDCERTFGTERGKSVHHSRTHKSKTKINTYCTGCGCELELTPSEFNKSERNFCSRECHAEWQSGGNHPNYKEYVKKDCLVCGSSYQVRPSISDIRITCSNECQRVWQQEAQSGEQNGNWRGGTVSVECDVCGVEFEAKQYEMPHRKRCGHDCHAKWLSENVSGDNHPRWNPNKERTSYGPRWPKKRESRLEYDGYECVVCGMSNAESKETYGKGLDVHHIEKLESYRMDNGEIDYERANRRENLITMCKKCHNRWEGIPLRPDV